MSPQHVTLLIQIASGVMSLGLLLLTAIWSEMRKLNNKLSALTVTIATQDARLCHIEKDLDRLPCLVNISCRKGDNNEKFYT